MVLVGVWGFSSVARKSRRAAYYRNPTAMRHKFGRQRPTLAIPKPVIRAGHNLNQAGVDDYGMALIEAALTST